MGVIAKAFGGWFDFGVLFWGFFFGFFEGGWLFFLCVWLVVGFFLWWCGVWFFLGVFFVWWFWVVWLVFFVGWFWVKALQMKLSLAQLSN